jgi:quinol monooxygenase YgiN
MERRVKILALLTARAGRAEELFELLFRIRPHCLAEPGNLRWDIWQDQTEFGRFALEELYRDAAAVAAHRETPHFHDYAARIGDLADRTVVTLAPLAVAPDGD